MKCLLMSLFHFIIGLFLMFSFENFASTPDPSVCGFSPTWPLSFYPLNRAFSRIKAADFEKVQLVLGPKDGVLSFLDMV